MNGKENLKILTNIFSREKSLIYFCLWDDSDRKGIKIAGTTIKNNLFIIPSRDQKGSVWYEAEELQALKEKFIEKLKDHDRNSVWNTIRELAENSWRFIEPYAQEKKDIKTTEEFEQYYQYLVDFWVSLNSIMYEIVDDKRLDPVIRGYLTNLRKKTERYTEKMSSILTDYLQKNQELKEISHVLTFKEALDVLHHRMDKKELQLIEKRINGCFMFNGSVYLMDKLKKVLGASGLVVERVNINVTEITGSCACQGFVRGKVKIINGFEDLNKIKKGDILVTQMTNPKYLSAILKSAAVITDQGGTLCHAAIVAREFNIPCIVGTKIATQALHDGDLVEVDATKGRVKILSRKKGFKK